MDTFIELIEPQTLASIIAVSMVSVVDESEAIVKNMGIVEETGLKSVLRDAPHALI